MVWSPSVHGILNSLLQHHTSKASILRHSAFFTVQLSHPYMTSGKTIALSRWTLVGKVLSLLLNMLCRLVITFGKDSDAGRDWRQEGKGTTVDEMVGRHQGLNGHEFEQAPGDGEGQGSLACYNPWGRKESDATSVQFSSVAQSCPTLCNPMNHSMPGLPVHHHLLEFTQTHVH